MQLKLFIVPVKNMDAAEHEMNAFLRGQPKTTRLTDASSTSESSGRATFRGRE